jgi:hypothetical protein
MRVEHLDRECRVYTRYFIGREPDAYLVSKYRDYHSLFPPSGNATLLDRALLGLSRKGVLGARLADIYASRFAKACSLRRKLSLMLALIESSPFCQWLEVREPVKPLTVCWRIAWGSMIYAAGFVIASAGLVPVHLLSAALARQGER